LKRTYSSICLFETTLKHLSISTHFKKQKAESQSRVQDVVKIILCESNSFWKNSFRFHLFGLYFTFGSRNNFLEDVPNTISIYRRWLIMRTHVDRQEFVKALLGMVEE
jgi:hypothetical protein